VLEFEIDVSSPADRLLYEGLPLIAPALDALGTGALLIGGLATAAWLGVHPVGMPPRATRDLDLGIDRQTLRITKGKRVVGPILQAADFTAGFGGEEFRFVRETSAGDFVVDCLVARGASRQEPPLVETGMNSLAAPGLAYAIGRGPVPLRIVLCGAEPRKVTLSTITLDAAFVMKAALAASGVRTRPDRRVADTADGIMLAAACIDQPDAIAALRSNARRSEVRTAMNWIDKSFGSERAVGPRRFSEYAGAEADVWALDVARRMLGLVKGS
jgi:hypothetical protein